MKYDYLLFDVDGTVLSFEAAEKAQRFSKSFKESISKEIVGELRQQFIDGTGKKV